MLAKMKKIYWLVPVILFIVAGFVITLQAVTPGKHTITGMVETKQIDVSSKIPGRIEEIYIQEGDKVEKGSILAKLESREINAKVEQARGVMQAARAKMQMAHNGLRPEELEAIEKLVQQAQHQFDLAEKTYNRVKKVYQDSVISTQEYDQVEFKYKAAKEQLDAANAKFRMAKKGARQEEKSAAEGLFHQAENAYKEALAYQDELLMKAPIKGTMKDKYIDAGEMIASGYPVFSIIDPSDIWIVINVREDRLANFNKEKTVLCTFPALGKQTYEFKVTYLSEMADFATWRATNQKGDFDLKTFEVHLRPVQPISGLFAGMSAYVQY